MQMMDRRKFKRRKPADGEVRNRVLDDIEPGVTTPVPDRGSRVFARAKSDASVSGKGSPSQQDILARARDAMQNNPDDSGPLNMRPVSPGEDASRARERIAELRREKARLQAERTAREERQRAKQAALQAAEARRLAVQEDALLEETAKRQAQARQEAKNRAAMEEARALEAETAEMRAQEAESAAQEADALAAQKAEAERLAQIKARQRAVEAESPAQDLNPGAVKAAAAPLLLGPELAKAAEPAPEADVVPVANRRPAAPPKVARAARPAPVERDHDADDLWDSLKTFPVDAKHFERNRIITAAREDLAHTAFDVLRTRLLQGLRRKGWKRVAITSPSKDCGKTFSAVNLALSLSRQDDCRTILLDFDMRRPSLAKVFGAGKTGNLGDMLRGKVAPEDFLRCVGENPFDIGRNLAIGFNDRVEPYASELLADKLTGEVLDDMAEDFGADVVLFDMPPALYHDDVIAARSLFDGVLLVVGGGITKPNEVKDVERRLGADTPLLGTLLNFSEGAGITKYSY